MRDLLTVHHRLHSLFRDGEWDSERAWRRRRRDRNPFMSANVALIIERTRSAPALAGLLDSARAGMAAYQRGHQAWHWPHEAGRSRVAHAPWPWRTRLFDLSPDADCSCLVQLARGVPEAIDPLLDDLAFYRAGSGPFRLPAFQADLPGVAGSCLTWFPPRERCRPGTLETVDVAVTANILLFLARRGRLDAVGGPESQRFVADVIGAELALRDPFRVSPYYPFPAMLLYLISRAAVWGSVPSLLALRTQILSQVRTLRVNSTVEALCRAATFRLWHETDSRPVPIPDGQGAFYVAPLLMWPLQRARALERWARDARWWIAFRCEALEWALWLAATEEEPGEGEAK